MKSSNREDGERREWVWEENESEDDVIEHSKEQALESIKSCLKLQAERNWKGVGEWQLQMSCRTNELISIVDIEDQK